MRRTCLQVAQRPAECASSLRVSVFIVCSGPIWPVSTFFLDALLFNPAFSAFGFALCVCPFAFQSSFDGTARRLGPFPAPRRHSNGCKQRPEFFHAIRHVPALVTELLTRQHQIAAHRYSAWKLR